MASGPQTGTFGTESLARMKAAGDKVEALHSDAHKINRGFRAKKVICAKHDKMPT